MFKSPSSPLGQACSDRFINDRRQDERMANCWIHRKHRRLQATSSSSSSDCTPQLGCDVPRRASKLLYTTVVQPSSRPAGPQPHAGKADAMSRADRRPFPLERVLLSQAIGELAIGQWRHFSLGCCGIELEAPHTAQIAALQPDCFQLRRSDIMGIGFGQGLKS